MTSDGKHHASVLVEKHLRNNRSRYYYTDLRQMGLPSRSGMDSLVGWKSTWKSTSSEFGPQEFWDRPEKTGFGHLGHYSVNT